MLQAPSHFSRVCGHGHIKKFWLMQTQKESQACESKSSVLFPSPPSSRTLNKASVRGLDSSPRSPPSAVGHSSGFGDAVAPSAKHSSFTCAETLSPPSHFSKANSPLSHHSTTSTGGLDSLCVRSEGVDSVSRTVGQDVHPSTPSPRSHPLNVAPQPEYKPQREPHTITADVDQADSWSSEGSPGSDGPFATSVEASPHSNGNHGHSYHTQHGKDIRYNVESVLRTKDEGYSSPAHRDISGKVHDSKCPVSHVRLSLPTMVLEGVPESSRSNGATYGSRTHDSFSDRRPQASHLQNSGLKVCTLCGTTKTPMWRSGPQGPKSLCNACGIRFKKYRSFPGQSDSPEAMGSPLPGPVPPKSLARPLKRKQNTSCEPSRPQKMCFKSVVPEVSPVQQKKSKWFVVKRENGEIKELNGDSSSPWTAHTGRTSFKKIYGCTPFQPKFKKLAPMDEHPSVSRVFAKDEEEAAVLLMHLSCGLVY